MIHNSAAPARFQLRAEREVVSRAYPAVGSSSHRQPSVPDHELLRCVGRGAYGEVWLARSALGTYRAVKVVYRRSFQDDRPFDREFSGIQKFEPISRSHPGLVNILQVGRHPDYFYYVMELADPVEVKEDGRLKMEAGETEPVRDTPFIRRHRPAMLNPSSYSPHTLREDLRDGDRLPAAQCVEIGLALTSALDHLHKQGLVHRDIKPSNIIFVQGRPKLADIGLVTEEGDSQSIVGTEGYLPPEGPGMPRADIFALGKVIYEVATGQDRRQFPDLPSVLKDWPDREIVLELNEILLKACAQASELRYQSCQEIHDELKLLREGGSVRRERATQRRRASGKQAGLIAIGIAAISAATILMISSFRDSDMRSIIPGVNELVEQGDHCLEGETSERIGAALVFYNEAIARDPGFVPAYFGRFHSYVGLGAYDRDAPADLRLEFLAAAAKLEEMAPWLAESHAAASLVKWADWKFPEALAEAHKATRIRAASKRGRATAHNLYGFFLLQTGKPDEALEQYQLAEKLTPSNPGRQHHLGHPYFVKREFDKALEHYEKSLKLEPRQSMAHLFIRMVFEAKGDYMRAIEELEQSDLANVGNGPEKRSVMREERRAFYARLREAVLRDGEKGYWTERLDTALKESPPKAYSVAVLYAHLGDKEGGYAWLRKACEQRAFSEGPLFDLCWDRNDEEFKAIVRGIGLLQ